MSQPADGQPDLQPELPLGAPPLPEGVPPVPARMLNEYVYCPRLAYLEWVQGEWQDNADTVSGRLGHSRVDKPRRSTAEKLEDDPTGDEHIHITSLHLTSERLGITAKLDLAELAGQRAVPVDYKNGKRPHVAKGAHEPERVQLCVQGMLLEDAGFEVTEGVLYFMGSRERVIVKFDDELRQQTANALAALRLLVMGGQIPPPLIDSPKCSRCSLASICLPDETWLMRGGASVPRPIALREPAGLPLYVQARGAKVSKAGNVLEIRVDDSKVAEARIAEVSQVVLQGGVYITAPALHDLMARAVPVTWLSHGGWFLGHTIGTGHRNVELRTAQYRASFDPAACLRIAREVVVGKIRNQRTLLRRNCKDDALEEEVLNAFRFDVQAAGRARGLPELLGMEGNSAARYFQHFARMLRAPSEEEASQSGWAFDFNRRNRRPPTDPVNALLSYAYSLLTRHVHTALSAVGFDPYRGFYHQPRYGRPALALDVMEPFRPLIADSAVIMVINNGEVTPGDFVRVQDSVNLTESGRKTFIAAFERRLEQEATQPLFGYTASYRQIIEVQCRMLGRHLLGETPDWPSFTTR